MIVSNDLKVQALCIAPAQDITEMDAESFTALTDQIAYDAETTRPGETGETTLTDLEAVENLHEEVLTGKVSVEEAYISQKLTRILFERLDVKKHISTLPAQLSGGYSSGR